MTWIQPLWFCLGLQEIFWNILFDFFEVLQDDRTFECIHSPGRGGASFCVVVTPRGNEMALSTQEAALSLKI